MAQLLVRGDLPCYDNVAYYVCSKNNSMGCCSVDPCASGICPDHTNITTSMTTVPTAATTKAAGETFTTSAAKTTSFISSQSITSAAPTLSSTTAAESSSAAATASPTDSSSGSSHHSEGALIGGLATGFVALLLISGILSFFIARTRRRRGKRFTLLDWHGPNNQDQGDNGNERVTRRDMGPAVYGNEEGLFNAPTYIAYQPPPSTRSRSSSPATSNISKPINTAYSPYTLALNSVDSATKSTVPLLPSTSTTSSADSIQLTTSIPQKRTFTPELPDTGFYRQRAELASYSQSELINIPLDQRQRIKPVEHYQKPITTPPRTTSTPPIVTSDGIVLGANFDRITPAYDSIYPEKGGGEPLSHVMSFMHYDSGSESGRGDSKEWPEVTREVPKRKSIKQKVRSRLM